MARLIVTLLLCLAFGAANATGTGTAHCARGKAAADGYWWHDEEAIMGTDVRVELWHPDEQVACDAIRAVMAEMQRIDNTMSPYISTSTLSKLNREAGQHPVRVGPEMFTLISRSLEISDLTHGAFDVTYASAGRYYNFRQHIRPDAATLAEAVKSINYHYLQMNAGSDSIKYLHPHVYVDLGGIAKGHAVDRCIDILKKRGITQAMVGAGGDSRILGDRLGEPWVVGIKDPRHEGRMSAVLPLMDVAVSTSGDYERYFEKDGVRYHHIIDPKTGDSARRVASVTILGNDATTTDALSTSVFVMGPEEGLALVNRMPGIDAIIIDGKGRMYVSQSLMEMQTAQTEKH